MLKFLYSKRGDGVMTGMLWMAAAAIVAGVVSYVMWGNNGIGGAATAAKAEPLNSVNTLLGSGSGGLKGYTP